MPIGENIKKLRIEKGLTQKQLGDLCGMADSAIRRYESGRGNPTEKTLKRIAAALNVPWYELYSDKEEEQLGIVADFVLESAKEALSKYQKPTVDREFVDYWNSSELEKIIGDNFNPFYKEWIARVGEIDEKYGKRLEEGMKEGYKLGYMAAQGLKPKNVETLVAAGIDEREAEFLLHFSNYPSEEQKVLLNVMERIHKQSMNTDKGE